MTFDFFEDKAVEIYENGETAIIKADKFSIKDKLNKHLRKSVKTRKSRWLAPSKIWNIDPSEFIYSYFVGLPEVVDFDSRMRMDFGTVAHDTIQRIMVEMGVLKQDTVERFVIDARNGMAGKIDGIVKPGDLLAKNRKPPSEECSLEIKTCNERAYEGLYFVSDIPDYYKAQAEVYQIATNIPSTLFVYVNSATFAMKCLFYEHTGHYYEKVCQKANDIWRHIAARELPEYKICSKEKWQELIQDVTVPLSREQITYGEEKKETVG